MKKLITLLIVLPILGFIIAIVCGVPVLDWVAWLFDLIAKMFDWVGGLCSCLQDWISWVVH